MKGKLQRRISLFFLCLALLFHLVACKQLTTPISSITGDPDKYENKTVLISGTVVSSQKLSSSGAEGSFVLDDGTGQIKVVTRKSIPPVNKKTFVKGKVQSNFVIFGKHFGIVIRED